LVEIYRDDPDPGVHGAAGWLLRHWGQQEKLAEMDLAAMRKPVETLPGLRREVIVKLADNVLLELVLIRPGSFVMGENNSRLTDEDERPAHKVTISRAFYLGKYPVTQEQWQAVMGSNPSYFKDVKNPMEGVSWEDCQAFLKKLNEKAGKTLGTFRLPTEAEWEYACRAGSTTMYSFGDEEGSLGDYGWFSGNSVGRTHPAGERKPNVWGLYDMHGNVCQWCQDRYGAYPALEQVDPQGTAQGSVRMFRGGYWGHDPQDCRSAIRFRSGPGARLRLLGCRLALVPSGSGK
jgi:formylglycine-generating enzyme required for sulfatase activity